MNIIDFEICLIGLSTSMFSMWANNMLRANNVKTGKFFKKWHNKALMIDIRKTKIVIDTTDPENAPSCTDQNQFNLEVPGSQLLIVEDLLEEPQEEKTSSHWLTQAFSSA